MYYCYIIFKKGKLNLIFLIFGGKEIEMLVNIIIKLIINLIL